jgi:hypothetical protein
VTIDKTTWRRKPEDCSRQNLKLFNDTMGNCKRRQGSYKVCKMLSLWPVSRLRILRSRNYNYVYYTRIIQCVY